MPCPWGPTLPVQVESCDLGIVSLKVDEVEEVGGCLFISLLSGRKGGLTPWTQTWWEPERRAEKHDWRERETAFHAFSVHVCLMERPARDGPWLPWLGEDSRGSCKTRSCRRSPDHISYLSHFSGTAADPSKR